MSSLICQIISHKGIIEKLGGGGRGNTFNFEDSKLTRTVALKLLPESYIKEEESNKRLILEAQAASSPRHNNISTFYEIDERKTDSYLI